MKKLWAKFRSSKFGWVVFATLVGLAILVAAAVSSGLLIVPYNFFGASEESMGLLASLVFPVSLVGCTVGAAFLFRKKLGKSVKDILKLKKPNRKAWWVVPAVLFSYIGLLIVAMIILQVVNPNAAGQEQDVAKEVAAMSGLSLGLMAFAVGILTPIAEEIFFRGFLLSMYVKKLNYLVAICLGAFFFGLAHFQLNVSLDTTIFGIGLGILTWQTDSIYPAISLHMLKNLIAVIFIVFS